MIMVLQSRIVIGYGPVAQLVRAPPCHGGGRRFESDLGRSSCLREISNSYFTMWNFADFMFENTDSSGVQGNKNGSKGARTLGLPLVRRALIPAELCFHGFYYNTAGESTMTV